jgi:hypothetical protein
MSLAKADPTSVIAWSVAMLLLLVVGLFWATRLKRKFKNEDVPAPPLGFTLSDLRDMHRAGQLTDDEFAKAKAKIVVAAQKAAEKVPAPQGVVERDSADAIRARRALREQQDGGETKDA